MNRKRIILIGLIAVAIGAAYGLKEYMRGHADVEGMEVAHAVDAQQLLADFMADESTATANYVGVKEQAIVVKGLMKGIEKGAGDAADNVLLDSGDDFADVICEFKKGTVPGSWQPGSIVAVKGICTGYLGSEMLPGNVILQRCVAVE